MEKYRLSKSKLLTWDYKACDGRAGIKSSLTSFYAFAPSDSQFTMAKYVTQCYPINIANQSVFQTGWHEMDYMENCPVTYKPVKLPSRVLFLFFLFHYYLFLKMFLLKWFQQLSFLPTEKDVNENIFCV